MLGNLFRRPKKTYIADVVTVKGLKKKAFVNTTSLKWAERILNDDEEYIEVINVKRFNP